MTQQPQLGGPSPTSRPGQMTAVMRAMPQVTGPKVLRIGVVQNGKVVGLSTYTGYTYNERSWLSLGVVNNAQAAPGTEVTIVWGEDGRGTSKPTVERHKQIEVRAVVAPVPISEVARVAYRPK